MGLITNLKMGLFGDGTKTQDEMAVHMAIKIKAFGSRRGITFMIKNNKNNITSKTKIVSSNPTRQVATVLDGLKVSVGSKKNGTHTEN